MGNARLMSIITAAEIALHPAVRGQRKSARGLLPRPAHPGRAQAMGGSFASLHLRRWLVGTALLFLVGGIALGLPRSARADGEPSPDPSGLATGDRTSVMDAGGSAFTVAEP